MTTQIVTNWDLFEPEPEPADVNLTIISVDDHVVEPPHLFESRVPSKLVPYAPRVVEKQDGSQVWLFEGEEFTQIGMNAVAGRKREVVEGETFSREPFRFDEMRPGCFEIEARIKDMDLNGVWASLNFPSMITGFCGRLLFSAKSREIGIACIRAWNDWIYEEWYQAHPDRIIPLGVLYLPDPTEAVAEIHRLAELGFRSVSLPERPHRIGLPSLWVRDHWDPILRACTETGTVVSLHVGSAGSHDFPPGFVRDGVSGGLGATLFGQLSLQACGEWLWSGWPLKYPELRIAMSEGGIGWVAMLLDRLDNIVDRSGYGRGWKERPADVLRRNFWFCTLDDPSTIDTRYRIGIENIMVEVDYPHGDSTWPDTQRTLLECWGHIPTSELRMMCSLNAASLYSHRLPDQILPTDDFRR
jgi:predicted TIM-barrel fold metal-dependent hydrolase